MKKTLLVLCAGIMLVSGLSSCDKAYTCECVRYTGELSTGEVIATTRNEAQKKCNERGLLGHCEIK